ncbi:hypothetical protein AMATHDRAFT_5887 [Amanita thiersii Skay4041]|uniref:Uncharacterized protein n=1 Tax=Amanita thiersii Skay4041 TaxID=703135 RepID=A0A2A9NGB6_9AGAR|nr:hypothetical protein AMATHDRAFT_5887 [Amanita thiersii Skay4041]
MKRSQTHQDISRILDPSYSPAASKQLPLTVYVDRHGYLHDPDYRQFPTIIQPTNQSQSDDDEDATPVDNDFYSHLTNAYNRAGNAYLNTRKRQNQYSYIYASYRSSSYNYNNYYYPSPATSSSYSSPTSYESDATVFDDEDNSLPDHNDDSCHGHVNTLKKKLGKRRGSSCSSNGGNSSPTSSRRRKSAEQEQRRSSWSPGDTSSPHHPDDRIRLRHLSPHDELDEHNQYTSSTMSSSGVSPHYDLNDDQYRGEKEEQQPDGEQQYHHRFGTGAHVPEWTPTCTQNIKRQWQAISLRLRFSLFRAQRRVKRRFQSLI